MIIEAGVERLGIALSKRHNCEISRRRLNQVAEWYVVAGSNRPPQGRKRIPATGAAAGMAKRDGTPRETLWPVRAVWLRAPRPAAMGADPNERLAAPAQPDQTVVPDPAADPLDFKAVSEPYRRPRTPRR